MLTPVATTTLKLKDCGLNSIRVMVRVFEHPSNVKGLREMKAQQTGERIGIQAARESSHLL